MQDYEALRALLLSPDPTNRALGITILSSGAWQMDDFWDDLHLFIALINRTWAYSFLDSLEKTAPRNKLLDHYQAWLDKPFYPKIIALQYQNHPLLNIRHFIPYSYSRKVKKFPRIVYFSTTSHEPIKRVSVLRPQNPFVAAIPTLTLDFSGYKGALDLSFLSAFRQLETLTLHNYPHTDLPDAIRLLPQLRILCLSDTSIQQLPDDLSRWTRLHHLDLSRCPIKSLPTLPAGLRVLSLSGCRLTAIPAAVCASRSLWMLDISHNHIQKLPMDLARWSSMRTLWLHGNPLKKWEQDLSLLVFMPSIRGIRYWHRHSTHLRQLHRCKRYRVHSLSFEPAGWVSWWQWLSYMEQLQHLEIKRSEMPALPDDFAKCFPYLQRLDLSHNRLTSLPQVGGKWGQHITHLHLAHNQFSIFPPAIRQMRSLQVLDLSDNPIVTIPDWMGELQELDTLCLNRCQLQQLPASLWSLPRLCTLEVDGNALSVMPAAIAQLPRLFNLQWAGNGLTALPPELATCSLNVLSLSDNPLTDLPDTFAHFKYLRRLHLSYAPCMNWKSALAHIPSRTDLYWIDERAYSLKMGHTMDTNTFTFPHPRHYTHSHLAEINWSKTITALAAAYGDQVHCIVFQGITFKEPISGAAFTLLPHLRELTFSLCRNVCLAPDFAGLPNLQVLTMEQCWLLEIPKIVTQLPHLQSLNLGYNKISKIPLFLQMIQQPITIALNSNVYTHLLSSKNIPAALAANTNITWKFS